VQNAIFKIIVQNNSNSDLIPDEPDGMADDEDIPVLDSWTERTPGGLWVLGDQVEQSTPVDIEFTPWDESMLEIYCGDEAYGQTVHVEYQLGLDGHSVNEIIRAKI
jgi:hypothetical protein